MSIHQNLKIALIQLDLVWENPERNLSKIESILGSLQGVDLAILPEMCTTGFTMSPKGLALNENKQRLAAVVSWSVRYGMTIAGTFIWKTDAGYSNRFLWIRNGQIEFFYDKRHLFPLAGENRAYTAGAERVVAGFDSWNVSPFICYDLRFPVWCRNDGRTDMMIFCANWPDSRREHWVHLLIARAIENQCYVAGVNRVGNDEKGLSYSGDSVLIHPSGKILCQMNGTEGSQVIQADLSEVRQWRERFPFLEDRDPYTISF